MDGLPRTDTHEGPPAPAGGFPRAPGARGCLPGLSNAPFLNAPVGFLPATRGRPPGNSSRKRHSKTRLLLNQRQGGTYIAVQRGTTVLVATHDPVLAEMTSRTLDLVDGALVQQAAPAERP